MWCLHEASKASMSSSLSLAFAWKKGINRFASSGFSGNSDAKPSAEIFDLPLLSNIIGVIRILR